MGPKPAAPRVDQHLAGLQEISYALTESDDRMRLDSNLTVALLGLKIHRANQVSPTTCFVGKLGSELRRR